MNIAHFASDYYPNLGGVQEFVRQLTARQRLEGGSPLIVTNRWPKNLPASESLEGIPVRRFVFRVPERNWRQLAGTALWGAPTLFRIVRLLEKHRAEAIHIQCVSSNAYYALHASRILQLPLVATLHGELSVDDGGLFQRSAFAQKLLRKVLEHANAVTACSAHTLREAREFYGEPIPAACHVIRNGVCSAEFLGAKPHFHPRPYLLAIGRHVRQKGFDLLLQAFAKAVSSGLDSHDLLIAGEGPEKRNLETFSAALGLQHRVHFLGRTNRKRTAQLFLGCSFFVLPSRLEPLGIVNLEAMAAGKAILAANVGGVPEIVAHERNGILVERRNVDALANGILRLASDAALRNRLGASGLRESQQFDWSAASGQFQGIYQTLRTPARTDSEKPIHAHEQPTHPV